MYFCNKLLQLTLVDEHNPTERKCYRAIGDKTTSPTKPGKVQCQQNWCAAEMTKLKLLYRASKGKDSGTAPSPQKTSAKLVLHEKRVHNYPDTGNNHGAHSSNSEFRAPSRRQFKKSEDSSCSQVHKSRLHRRIAYAKVSHKAPLPRKASMQLIQTWSECGAQTELDVAVQFQ